MVGPTVQKSGSGGKQDGKNQGTDEDFEMPRDGGPSRSHVTTDDGENCNNAAKDQNLKQNIQFDKDVNKSKQV